MNINSDFFDFYFIFGKAFCSSYSEFFQKYCKRNNKSLESNCWNTNEKGPIWKCECFVGWLWWSRTWRRLSRRFNDCSFTKSKFRSFNNDFCPKRPLCKKSTLMSRENQYYLYSTLWKNKKSSRSSFMI